MASTYTPLGVELQATGENADRDWETLEYEIFEPVSTV